MYTTTSGKSLAREGMSIDLARVLGLRYAPTTLGVA
jgi:hypothetical protein